MVTITKQELKDILSLIKTCGPVKNDILHTVFLKKEGSAFTIGYMNYSSNKGVKISFETEDDNSWKAPVYAHSFVKALKTLDGEEITLSAKNGKLLLTSARDRIKLPTTADTFPSFFKDKKDFSTVFKEISTTALKKIFSPHAYLLAQQNHIARTSFLSIKTAEPNTLEVVSTNSYVLLITEIPLNEEVTLSTEEPISLPLNFPEIIQELPDNYIAKVEKNENLILLNLHHSNEGRMKATIYTSFREGKMVDYKPIKESAFNNAELIFKVPVKELSKLVRKISSLQQDSSTPITFTVSNAGATVTVNTDTTSLETSLEAHTLESEQGISISYFILKAITDGLDKCQEDQAELQWNGEGPFAVKGSLLTAIAMPLARAEEKAEEPEEKETEEKAA